MSDAEHATPDIPATERTTAPQSPYEMRQVLIGFLVFVVGLAITFGVSVALT